MSESKGVNLKMSQWTGNSGLYLWKEQEFKKVEEVWPLLKMKNKVGHISSTIIKINQVKIVHKCGKNFQQDTQA